MWSRAPESAVPVKANAIARLPALAPRVPVRCRDPEAGALEVCPRSSIYLPEKLDTSGRLGLLVPKVTTAVLSFSTANGYSRYRKCKDKERQIGI